MAYKNRADLNAYMRKHLKEKYKRRKEWAATQLGGKCAECGQTEGLEFDYPQRIGPKPTTQNILLGRMDRIVEEMANWQLLCQPCHTRKSTSKRQVPHGGGKRGRNGCKCFPCRVKAAEYMRQWREKKNRRGMVQVGSTSGS